MHSSSFKACTIHAVALLLAVESNLLASAESLASRQYDLSPDDRWQSQGAASSPLRGSAAAVQGRLDAAKADDKHEARSLMESARLLLYIPNKIYNHIAVDVKYNNYWEEFMTFPERRPEIFNVVLATFKTTAADLIVQSGQGQAFDFKRSATFALFGFLYVGVLQWVFYVSILTDMCPYSMQFANEPWSAKLTDRRGQEDLVKQILIDNLILQTFIYYPIFYTIKEIVAEPSLINAFKHMSTVTLNAFKKYRENCLADNIAGWAYWTPLDLLVFSAPMFVRMPLAHAFSFLWTMVVSYFRGSTLSKTKDEV